MRKRKLKRWTPEQVLNLRPCWKERSVRAAFRRYRKETITLLEVLRLIERRQKKATKIRPKLQDLYWLGRCMGQPGLALDSWSLEALMPPENLPPCCLSCLVESGRVGALIAALEERWC